MGQLDSFSGCSVACVGEGDSSLAGYTRCTCVSGWVLANHINYTDRNDSRMRVILHGHQQPGTRDTAVFGQIEPTTIANEYAEPIYHFVKAPHPVQDWQNLPGQASIVKTWVAFLHASLNNVQLFNHALIHRYLDGQDYTEYISENIAELVPGSSVIFLLIGASRTLRLKKRVPNTSGEFETQDILMSSGVIFVLGWNTMCMWEHSIVEQPRLRASTFIIECRCVQIKRMRGTTLYQQTND